MKKKKKINEEKKGAGWLTTFNDLITLLMVFFVLLFTMSTIDVKKLKEVQYGLQSAIGVLKEGQRVSVEVIEPPIPPDVESVTTPEEIEEEVPDEIRDFVKAFDSEPEITATYTKKGVLITLSDTVLFQFGMADINPESFPVLDKIAAIISKTSESVRVEGHTDNVPVVHSKRFPSNWELSIKRAINVVKYFVEIGKIPPQRLSAVGYGESKPLFPNDTTEHRAGNRRVEMLLEMEDQG
ncbi:MAG: flagellar motor protein MotB [Desulfobacterales bacterium]|nr:flagellar motor protein MotB [Desulfobacterales bacterium]